MIELSPVPLYWILKLEKPKQLTALEKYQLQIWGLNLEVPPFHNPEDYRIAPIIPNRDQLAIFMKQKPHHPKLVK